MSKQQTCLLQSDRYFEKIDVDSEEDLETSQRCLHDSGRLEYITLCIFNDSMTITIALNSDCLQNLDLSPAQTVIEKLLRDGASASHEQQLRFEIDYPREPEDPRELPEIPEVRLWFIRLDAQYPWMPFLLDWKAGELARYTAMLVPHQFSSSEGIQYNPEALEIFVMHKIFVLANWMQQQGIPSPSRLKSMTQLLGYELDDAFFDLISSE